MYSLPDHKFIYLFIVVEILGVIFPRSLFLSCVESQFDRENGACFALLHAIRSFAAIEAKPGAFGRSGNGLIDK